MSRPTKPESGSRPTTRSFTRAKPAAGDKPATSPPDDSGNRIAKVIARAGLASRRDAERMIAEGRVTLNGKPVTSPALDVTPKDRIAVDGAPLPAADPPRVWLYHKPEGLVTSARDEQGRATVFDHLPEDMPRVMTIGRLDLNSEGLLLLTNDGDLKRRLELPSTGWLRRYRVRVNGRPEDTQFDPLREGITVDGESFQPMTVTLDRQQGANAWLTVGLREGRNREVRRAMEAVGLTVNRLIRISYGPFQLGELRPGEVSEVRPRMLRDQLGLTETPARPEPGSKDGPKGAPRRRSADDTRAPRAAPDKPARPAKPGAGAGVTRKPTGARNLATSAEAWLDRHDKPARGPVLKGPGAKPAATRSTAPRSGPAADKPAGGRSGTAKPAPGKPAGSKPGVLGRGGARPEALADGGPSRRPTSPKPGPRSGGAGGGGTGGGRPRKG